MERSTCGHGRQAGAADLNVRLDGRVAVVTGGSAGLGRAIAESMVEAGANVMLVARHKDSLDVAARAITHAWPGAGVETFAADVAVPADAKACVDATVERFGAVDILVNNASQPVPGRLMDLDPDLMTTAAVSSMVATVVWTQAAWRAWMENHGGAIVNMASVARESVEIAYGFYGATKAAVARITQQMAAELGPGVRANAVAPGWIHTPRLQPVVDQHKEALEEALPLGRLGVPDDVARAVVFLASDAAAYITGQVISIDGGRLATPGPLSRILKLSNRG
jgi:NAD(P)-dependent dehydrogenase (short-subunit alcohol dehydrogenase family)